MTGKACLVLALIASSLGLHGSSLSESMTARLLVVISRGAGEGGKVLCKKDSLAAELRNAGADVSAVGRVAWASNANEAKMFNIQGKLVVCGDMDIFQQGGAALAITEVDGKPKLTLNAKNVAKSGLTLSDQIMKITLSQ